MNSTKLIESLTTFHHSTTINFTTSPALLPSNYIPHLLTTPSLLSKIYDKSKFHCRFET